MAVENVLPMDRPRTDRIPPALLLLRMGLAGVGGGRVDTRVAVSVTRPPRGLKRSALDSRFCTARVMRAARLRVFMTVASSGALLRSRMQMRLTHQEDLQRT